MFFRVAPLRRAIYYICIIIASVYVFNAARSYYRGESSGSYRESRSRKSNQKFLDENGTFLPNPGYKILQRIEPPPSDIFKELYFHLELQPELREYFTFVPHSSYHVTLAQLKDATDMTEKHLEILAREQERLDRVESETTCTAKRLAEINEHELRLEIEFTPKFLYNRIKTAQKRWKAKFPKLIVELHTSFYIVLAHQHKHIPDKEIFDNINKMILEWQQFPFSINLDPIEICACSDLITYTPIVPDTVEL